jgi:hypothetical protein
MYSNPHSAGRASSHRGVGGYSREPKYIIKKDVIEVESRLKKSCNPAEKYITGKIYFQSLKDRHHERSIKLVAAS